MRQFEVKCSCIQNMELDDVNLFQLINYRSVTDFVSINAKIVPGLITYQGFKPGLLKIRTYFAVILCAKPVPVKPG